MNYKMRLLCLMVATSMLSGCVAFMAGAAAGGAVIYDRRATHVMVDDQTIALQAKNAVFADPILRTQTHVEFAAFNYVLLMTGQVPNEEMHQEILKRVKRIPNIKRLYDELTITAPRNSKQRSKDTWITAKVKSEMLATSGLHSSQIKVVTEAGSVYLMGLVTPRQAEMAVGVTSAVQGVKRVVKLFEYER